MGVNKISLSNSQSFWLITLRVVIGWHFLYEGLVKLSNPIWSSFGFLSDSQGFMKDVFIGMAANPDVLAVVDFLNIWGLIAIGAGLILGLLNRIALWSGIVLLSMYYLSHPAFFGFNYALPMEGSYFLVNKILIELVAMVVLLLFPTSRIVGLDRLIFGFKGTK
jgi:thiosulfate dehydrogenase (quinone) large subunit